LLASEWLLSSTDERLHDGVTHPQWLLGFLLNGMPQFWAEGAPGVLRGCRCVAAAPQGPPAAHVNFSRSAPGALFCDFLEMLSAQGIFAASGRAADECSQFAVAALALRSACPATLPSVRDRDSLPRSSETQSSAGQSRQASAPSGRHSGTPSTPARRFIDCRRAPRTLFSLPVRSGWSGSRQTDPFFPPSQCTKQKNILPRPIDRKR
jgi:hypothetical protein